MPPKKPLGKFKPTPKFRVYGNLRRIYLQSAERAYALKRDNYTCKKCGRKQSKRKGEEVIIHVHHLEPVSDAWRELMNQIYKRLLVHPDKLECLCSECHKKEKKKARYFDLGNDKNSF